MIGAPQPFFYGVPTVKQILISAAIALAAVAVASRVPQLKSVVFGA